MSTVTFERGDMFASDCASLVNPVNCVGTSGAGLAKAFKKRHADAVGVYERSCRYHHTEPGLVMCCWSPRGELHPPSERYPVGRAKLIYFFPTKLHWRDPSQIQWIEVGLHDLTKRVIANLGSDLPSVGIPALGCGHGGLPWAEVRPLIEAAAKKMAASGVTVRVYEPHAPPRGRR